MYTAILKRWWLPLLAGTMLGGATAFAVSTIISPNYVATTTLLVFQHATPGAVSEGDLNTSLQLAGIVSSLAAFDGVAQEAVEQGDLPMTSDEIRASTVVGTLGSTPLIQVQAVSQDSELAQRIADSVAAAIIATNESQRVPRGTITVVQPADPGVRSSDRRLNAALGGALGFFAVFGVLFVRESARPQDTSG